MTEKLYNTNSYIKEFSAVVIGCDAMDDGCYRVLLDKTGFFPEEGGQSCDKGTINGIEVLDVSLSNDIIYHKMPSSLEVGSVVLGKLDWEHRFSNMQMHSGEHVFSGLVKSLYGYNNVGFHLSDASATMDYDGKLTSEDIKKLEEMANNIIWSNRAVRVFFPTKEELDSLNFRAKPKGIVGDLRLVEIDGVDLCACCAPHVSLTGEIGLFKIVSFENYKGGTRLNFLCGKRAFDFFSSLNSVTSEIGSILNSSRENLTEAVRNVKQSLADSEYANVELRRKILLNKIAACKNGVLFLLPEETDLLKFAVNELKKGINEVCAVFAGDDEKGYRFIVESDSKDLNETVDELRNLFGAKCGGKRTSIQGNLEISKAEISRYFIEKYQ